MNERIECTVENASKFLEWCKSRGGVARWRSIDLGDPGKSWSTPALTPEGQPYPKPTWQAESTPSLVESDPAKITVFTDKEVKRFRVGLKRGYGLQVVCTDAATRRIRAAVEKAGPDAYYAFDYSTQEAVILRPDSSCTLAEWAERQAAVVTS